MVSRRDFLKFGTASAATASLLKGGAALAHEEDLTVHGGVDYSYLSGAEREAVATACGLCASRCPAIAYVENG